MNVRRLFLLTALGLALLTIPGGPPISAQEPGSARHSARSDAPDARKDDGPIGRLPAYFGQIGLPMFHFCSSQANLFSHRNGANSQQEAQFVQTSQVPQINS